jgi:ribosomal-protein-alanine N-acetyltransferase
MRPARRGSFDPPAVSSFASLMSPHPQDAKPAPLETDRLRLVPLTREEAQAEFERMPADVRALVSTDWLALLAGSLPADLWIHGFAMVHRDSGRVVGRCGFKGPPDAEGTVELGYGVESDQEGKGYATEAAGALLKFALSHNHVRRVRAHTLPEANASTRVLTKCGFQQVGEVMDPEDGRVWRWEKSKPA